MGIFLGCVIGLVIGILFRFIVPFIYWPFKFLFELAITVIEQDYWFPKGYKISDFLDDCKDDEGYKLYCDYRWIPFMNILSVALLTIVYILGIIGIIFIVLLRSIIWYIIKPLWKKIIFHIIVYIVKVFAYIFKLLRIPNILKFINNIYNKFIHWFINIRLG